MADLALSDPRPLGRMLADQAARYGSKPLLLYGEDCISYEEMFEWAQRCGRGLFELGVRHGDTICVFLNNSPTFLAAIYGLLSIGAIEVPINTAYKGDMLAYIIDHSDARGIIIEAEYLPRLAAIRQSLSKLEWVCVVGAGDEPVALAWPVYRFEELYKAPANLPDVQVSPYDIAGIMYTSGTTGPSKGVLCSHHYFYAFAAGWSRAVQLNQSDVYYTCLPYFHFNAQIACTYTSLITGATVAMDVRFSASRFWRSIKQYQATGFNLLGAMCYILLKQPPSSADREHQVRFCMAAPAPADIYHQFEERFGLRLIEGYGSTEANMPLYMPYDAPRPGSCGKPWGLLEVRIVDEYDWPLPPGQVGEIVVRPKQPWSMMSGYYKMPEKTAESWRNLFFHTGDRAYRDEDGYFYFVDRLKDAIRRRGENISSYEIERIINQHPLVLESAAIAVPSELSEDEVKIVVVLQPEGQLQAEELMSFCAARMPGFMVPRYVEFVEELPKTPNGKVEKHRLRALGVTPTTWDREAAGFRGV